MANEKSRNHDTKGGNAGASKHQGKPKDQAESGSKTSKASEAKRGSGDGSHGGDAKDKGGSEA